MKTTDPVALPTLDELALATEKLAIGAGDLDAIAMTIGLAIDPENPAEISLEQVGALLLYARDCESLAQEIGANAERLQRDVEALYYGQPTEENFTGSRSRALIETWHRESLEEAKAQVGAATTERERG